MTRPEAGPPPVGTSAVARREQTTERVDITNYRTIAEAFNRADRRAELLSMFGGSEELAGRFLAVALHAISSNSELLINADPLSIIQAVKDSAALGLEPTGLNGEGWIIRYKRTAHFQPGWRGYLKRIGNSGKVQDIDVQVVYENDVFEYGWSEHGGWFRHSPAKVYRDADTKQWVGRGDYWGAYAYAVMPSGFVEMDVMPVIDINDVRDQFSESWKGENRDKSPWTTSWAEMARKTVVRRLAKRLPQAAVDKLLEADARIEALRAGDDATPKMDISTARNAALAAVGAAPQVTAGGSQPLPVPEAPEPDADADLPTGEPETAAPRSVGNAPAEEPPEAATGTVIEEPGMPWDGAPAPKEER